MLLKDLKTCQISITYQEYEEMIRKIDRLEIENKYLKEQLECEKNKTSSFPIYGYWNSPKVTYCSLSNKNTNEWSNNQSLLRNWSQTASF